MGASGFVEVEGGKLYDEVECDGRPLLLIHGGLGSLRLVEFPGVAHMIHLEEPEAFNRLTLDFLADVDRQRG